MIRHYLTNFLKRNRCTLLGVGPMSKNCVDATIELANSHRIPIMLIASRRQVDSDDFGGGYVNNWTTREFARYVTDSDKGGRILLARDHGGPWQNNHEQTQNLSLRRAMESAKKSFEADIDAGFQIIHIDPSIDPHGIPTHTDILDRIFELLEFCWCYAQSKGREIVFEIGTEEQSGTTNTQDELQQTLTAIDTFCDGNKLPKPLFVVIQTGTRVMEMRNVGSFDSPLRVKEEIPAEIQVPKMIEICAQHNIFMKAHNTDYLSNESLQWHPRLGIHAANVAPEFGVSETLALVEILERTNQTSLADQFLSLSLNSKKWEKWMLPDSKASDREKAIIAGHYVFSTQDCNEIKKKAAEKMRNDGVDLERYLREQVKHSIRRYLYSFRLADRT